MRLFELLEKSPRHFGITGQKKMDLSVFFVQMMNEALIDMNASEDTGSTSSMGKRMFGAIFDRIFQIRNILMGREKHFEKKFRNIMSPYIDAMMTSMLNDHGDDLTHFKDQKFINEFKERFMLKLIANKNKLKELMIV